QVRERDALRSDDDHLLVHHVQDAVRVPQEGGDVGSEEVLVRPDADDERALVPRPDDLSRFVRMDRQDRIGSAGLMQRLPGCFLPCRQIQMIATPALSYPRYWSRFRPSNRMGNAFRRPAYPTIPHIYRTTAPAGIVPRSRVPDSTRARSLITVPGAALTPLPISTSSPIKAPN